MKATHVFRLRREVIFALLCAVLLCGGRPVLAMPADPDAPTAVTPTNDWADFYSYHLTLAGAPAPVGTSVTAYDPQGAQCGVRVIGTAGYLAPVMSCYGDDPRTPADEGAVEADLITFKVNGAPATAVPRALNLTPVSPTTAIRWHSKDAWDIDLTASAQPLLTIGRTAGQSNLTWQAAVVGPAAYEVWRSSHPYFNPVANEAELIGGLPATAVPLAWTDAVGAGDPTLNVSYRVVSTDGSGKLVGSSQIVGEFDFALTR